MKPMTEAEITDTISRIQHHLDTAAELMLELHTSKAHEILGITETALAWRIFGRPELKPESAYKRFYRAWRTAEMQAQISDLMADDADGHMSVDPATLPGTVCEALYKVQDAARLQVLKAAYRDNGGNVTVKAITEAAQAVAEYGVFNVLPDGQGGQVRAADAIHDLLYVEAGNKRRMDSNRVYVFNGKHETYSEFDEQAWTITLHFDLEGNEVARLPVKGTLKAAVWYEADSATDG